MLVTAGLNDPRVTYWEAAKYVAKLRALKTDKNVLLLKTNMGAGHQGKSGRYDSLREVAEEYAFVLSVMGRSYKKSISAAPTSRGAARHNGFSEPRGESTAAVRLSALRAFCGG